MWYRLHIYLLVIGENSLEDINISGVKTKFSKSGNSCELRQELAD